MIALCNQSGGGNAETRTSPLVLITNNCAPTQNAASEGAKGGRDAYFDKNTGEILNPEYSPAATTIERYALQSAAREILATKSGKMDRTCFCLRRVVHGADEVVVKKSVKHGGTHYKNLMSCGSVWKCPICNAKISENRAAEIRTAIDKHKAIGGKVALLTFTIPHERHDDLKFMVKTIQDAFNRTWKSPAAKRLKKSIEIDGYVRSKEVTYGMANGWHPHLHQLVLYFSDKLETDCIKEIKEELFPVWQNRCEKLGLGLPSYERGLDVRNGMSAAEYVAKFDKPQTWGLDKELTKSQTKKSKVANRYGPFDLLREYLQTGSENMARLFIEYSNGFHGSRFVTWSRGLKDKYDVDDSVKKDKEISESTDDEAITIVQISVDDWRKILFHKRQATILILAKQGRFVTEKYINSLTRPYKKNRVTAKNQV